MFTTRQSRHNSKNNKDGETIAVMLQWIEGYARTNTGAHSDPERISTSRKRETFEENAQRQTQGQQKDRGTRNAHILKETQGMEESTHHDFSTNLTYIMPMMPAAVKWFLQSANCM